jgi:hypothetical protein
MPVLSHFYLILQPLLLKAKGCNNHLIIDLAPLPWERGWGEAAFIKGVDGIIKET